MFYVIYNSATKQYLNEDMGYGAYKDAMKFNSHDDAKFEFAGDFPPECRIVGPCKEGEEP